jgi:quinoprotein glucose dehydrogenase
MSKVVQRSFLPLLFLCFLASAGETKDPISGEHRHYSVLNQITPQNVSQLQIDWHYDSGDAFEGSEIECTPTVVDGIAYLTTPTLRLVALDATNGQVKWTFAPGGNHTVEKSRNRGVAFWGGGDDERIFYAVKQYLYAVNARSGKLAETFGNQGKIDLRENLGRNPNELSVSLTSPPTIFKDLLIVGSIVSETLPSAPGDIRAYDVRSGRLRWSFHTIPRPGEFGYETWPKDAWKYSGGANNWSGLTVDRARGMLYVPTGSAAFDFYGSNRAGDNLFANCLLALRAETGERVWHFQTVHHDLWDRDLPAPPALVKIKRQGQIVDAVAQTTKSGYVFVFDRDTGKPLFPVEQRKAPGTDIEAETTSPTQPFPLLPPSFARQILTEKMLSNRTPQVHSDLVERLRRLKSGGQFVAPSREGTVIFPGFDGGAEWGGPAFDPETGVLYVNANEMAWILRLIPQQHFGPTTRRDLYLNKCASCHRADLKGTPPEFPSLIDARSKLTTAQIRNVVDRGAGRMPAFASLPGVVRDAIVSYISTGVDEKVDVVAGTGPIEQAYGIDGYNKFLDRDGYPAVEPPWGTLSAIDLNEGNVVWKIPLGEYPSLAKEGLTNTGSENYGGPVVTENGLLFIAATIFDNKIRAFHKQTGKLLWEGDLPAAGTATPVLYEAGGREFLLIACGGGKWGTKSGSSYVAFALRRRG